MSLVDEEIFALQNKGVIMDTIRTVLGLVTPNCWKASLDLKDAYYSVRIHPYFQKYLKFMYKGESLNTQFFLMVFHWSSKFTKMLKTPLSHLRLMNHVVSRYIDDLYLQGSAYQKCAINNFLDSVQMLDNPGLVIHPEKSVFFHSRKWFFGDSLLIL